MAGAAPTGATAEQASQPSRPEGARLDVGTYHACALLANASVRCWGYGGDGALGYANTDSIGDDETPASGGPVDLGAGRSAMAISTGSVHSCAILDDGSVRCWGYGGDGRLGYANTNSIGDDEAPGSAGAVDLSDPISGQHTARAISAGNGHTCAILDDFSVRCWGYGQNGALGYANTNSIGDNETPGSAGPVDLSDAITGPHTARAISAGNDYTCAILDDASVRCWGFGADGRLGYGNTDRIGDDETPGSAGPVALGAGLAGPHTAKAIAAGTFQTCAVLEDDTLRCWGQGATGALGYGNTDIVGDNETPAAVGPVQLGPSRTTSAITAGRHTCAILDDGHVRCWGSNASGQLGYANTNKIGDDELPAGAGPVDLGPGRTAVAISAGEESTCARLDDGAVRCWGNGLFGRLGYCNTVTIGDDESPAAAGPVNIESGDGGRGCATAAGMPPESPASAPATGPSQPLAPTAAIADGLAEQRLRAQGLRRCRARAARRHSRRQRAAGRRQCLKRWGRRPGRVIGARARAISATEIALSFKATGSDGANAPVARGYLIQQSLRSIRTTNDFDRAHGLCDGSCRFKVATVGASVALKITHLRPRTTYYYVVAARDNVTGLRGPRTTVQATTG